MVIAPSLMLTMVPALNGEQPYQKWLLEMWNISHGQHEKTHIFAISTGCYVLVTPPPGLRCFVFPARVSAMIGRLMATVNQKVPPEQGRVGGLDVTDVRNSHCLRTAGTPKMSEQQLNYNERYWEINMFLVFSTIPGDGDDNLIDLYFWDWL